MGGEKGRVGEDMGGRMARGGKTGGRNPFCEQKRFPPPRPPAFRKKLYLGSGGLGKEVSEFFASSGETVGSKNGVSASSSFWNDSAGRG